MLTFPVLIGDIGGTNARFAILTEPSGEPLEFPTVGSASFETLDKAIRTVVLDHTPVMPRSAVLAIAAPVEGDEIALTNSAWVVRPRQMFETLGLDEIVVLNDFEAQALAVVALGPDQMEKIGGGEAEPYSRRVVLGPGTGLGVAGLIHSGDIWIPIPGEGGHVDIGPRTARDLQVFPRIETIEGRISAEQMLCGRGLVNIYRAVCAADGVSASFNLPAQVTSAALEGTNRQAQEALDIFVTCLGRLAGDLALIFSSKGGVFLTGGIAQKIVPTLKSGRFREAFNDKAPHSQMIADIPVYVITEPLAPLRGLGAFASTPQRFGVDTSGRHWRRS